MFNFEFDPIAYQNGYMIDTNQFCDMDNPFDENLMPFSYKGWYLGYSDKESGEENRLIQPVSLTKMSHLLVEE